MGLFDWNFVQKKCQNCRVTNVLNFDIKTMDPLNNLLKTKVIKNQLLNGQYQGIGFGKSLVKNILPIQLLENVNKKLKNE